MGMKSRFSIAAGVLLTVFAFQNCGKGGFETSNGGLAGISLASTGGGTNNLGTCSFDGDLIPNGGSVQAYLSSTSTNSCTSQVRICTNGVLSGSYQYDSCAVGQQAACLFNGMTVQSGASVSAYAETNLAYGQTCQGQTRTCNSGALSGSYAYASCMVAKPSIVGTWVEACRAAATGSVQQTTTFTGSTFATTIRLYPLDTTCSSQYGFANLSGNYTLGDQVMGTNVNKLDLTSIQVSITPTSFLASLYLNGTNVCGHSDWSSNVPINVTGASCSINGYSGTIPTAFLYTSVRVQGGNMLYVGVPDNATQNGSSDGMRALTPDTAAMMKQ
jgi:hypothetical protein